MEKDFKFPNLLRRQALNTNPMSKLQNFEDQETTPYNNGEGGRSAKLRRTWIIITAYQEEQTIGDVVKRALLQSPFVAVIDDGSTDRTAKIAHEAGAYVLSHLFNLGQGAALQTGFSFALTEGADLIVTLDADGQHDPEDISRMISKIESSNADVVLGNRFSGKAIGISWRRRFILRCAWCLIRLTSGVAISDSQIGLRLFSSDAARKLVITQNRMAYASELINQMVRLKLNIVEIPVSVTYTDYSMKKGQSGLNSVNIIVDLIVGKILK